MKAEPESRIENGVDVAFSIDHLAAKTAPEPWDGELVHSLCEGVFGQESCMIIPRDRS
jgi:hypothetical protein